MSRIWPGTCWPEISWLESGFLWWLATNSGRGLVRFWSGSGQDHHGEPRSDSGQIPDRTLFRSRSDSGQKPGPNLTSEFVQNLTRAVAVGRMTLSLVSNLTRICMIPRPVQMVWGLLLRFLCTLVKKFTDCFSEFEHSGNPPWSGSYR